MTNVTDAAGQPAGMQGAAAGTSASSAYSAQLAEGLAEGAKGQGVVGVGRLLNDSWTDPSGTKRYGTRVEQIEKQTDKIPGYGARVENIEKGIAELGRKLDALAAKSTEQ